MFFNNNFSYSTPENGGFDFNSYPFGVTHGEPSTSAAQISGPDLDASVAGFSNAEIEDWWLESKSDGGVGQYAENTALQSPHNGFTGPYDSQTWNTSGTSGLYTRECHPGALLVMNTLFGANNSPR